jgi:hypothetical protein
MNRNLIAACVVAAITASVVSSIPATGALNPVSIAKRALTNSKQAVRKSDEADDRADQASSKVATFENRLGAAEQNAAGARALVRGLETPGDFPNGQLVTVSKTNTFPLASVDYTYVDCPNGTAVVSGGYVVLGGFDGWQRTNVFFAIRSGNGWAVGVNNKGAPHTVKVTVEAQCVPGNVAGVPNDHAREQALVAQESAGGG